MIATPVYKVPKSSSEGTVLWHQVNYFPLQQVVMQADAQFLSILSKVGNGERFSDGESKIIESSFRTVQWCDENIPNAVGLYNRNQDVDKFNRNPVIGAIHCVSTDRYIGYKTNAEKNDCRGELHNMGVNECRIRKCKMNTNIWRDVN